MRRHRAHVAAVLTACVTVALVAPAAADTPDGQGAAQTEGGWATLEGEWLPLYSETASLYDDLDGLTVTETEDGTEIATAADVLFEFDSYDLTSDAQDVLAEVAELLAELGPDEVLIRGHTDAVGTAEYNDQLSDDRAESVEAALEDSSALDGIAFDIEGVGFAEPVASEEDEDGEDLPEGRAQNRRVEFVFDGD